ncbi:MAG: glutamine--tRNA ligase/YqeY domain fusion protein [Magnetococcales bacterium]|nr:glutamine--tRNA ligase/YqeY domain fusion protein [Magnetococcales bacterium]
MTPEAATIPPHFIQQLIDSDLRAGRLGTGGVVTRFPPEPNGYLHIGHAKSIYLNFGMAAEFGGLCRLRFDDTNPLKEETEYVASIESDVCWMLGQPLSEPPRFTSSYFPQIYDYAEQLILNGKAYICDLSNEEIRATRGTLTEPGQESPYRNRDITENLQLFRRMRAGEFADGSRVLRARIDMAAGNINMRDPILYRIRRATHHQTGDTWCIYPTYDFSHCLADAIEGVSHSLCTLEFEDHRPLYDWILDQLGIGNPRPHQTEFSRLSIEYTVLSKRRLNLLVASGRVSGWDDPRMPTIAGLRRRGYTPEALRSFCRHIGISRADNHVEMGLLEHCIRDDLDHRAARVMAVLRPLKVVIENWPNQQVEWLTAPCHPQDPSMGSRQLPMTSEIWIEQDDFRPQAAKDFKRLILGGEVRLRNSYIIRCQEAVTNPVSGAITELRCTYDPKTLGTNPTDRKVRGVIHWVSAQYGRTAEIRLYDRLLTTPGADADGDDAFLALLNPDSLSVLSDCWVEPSLVDATPEQRFQFERVGFFCVDSRDSTPDHLVFNRTVALRDSWTKKDSG